MDREGNSNTLVPVIRKVRLDELSDYIAGQDFERPDFVPITWSRARSYLENPLAEAGDVVLLLYYLGSGLIAFRSIFAGQIYADGRKIRFGWCSGSWVHPLHRRKGISLLLLKEAYNDWDGKLMLTNYSPETEKLYWKSGLFREIHHFKGARAYLYPEREKLKILLKNKGLPVILAPVLSGIIDGVVKIRKFFFREEHPGVQYEEIDYPDAECHQLMRDNGNGYLFTRDEKLWNWIFRYPWLSDKNKELAGKYPFSASSDSFYYKTIKVRKNGAFCGFFVFSVRDNHLKVLGVELNGSFEDEISWVLKKYSITNNLATVTVYSQEIASCLLTHRLPYFHVKPYGQKIYSSFEIDNSLQYKFRDGEGDYIFT